MNIDSNNNISRVNGTQVKDVTKTPARKPTAEAASKPAASSQFQTSTAADSSKDINHARVAEIRQAISDGTLKFHSERIADGIIASARELASGND